MIVLRDDEDFQIVVRKERVVEIDKTTGAERELGEVEADRLWDQWVREGGKDDGKANS